MPRLSALVCVQNDDKRLAACLERLRFADELVVALTRGGSRSADIAHRLADRVILGDSAEGVAACSGDWILEIAPDEMVGEALAEEIRFVVGSTIAADRFLIPVESPVRGRHLPGNRTGRAAATLLYRRGSGRLPTGGRLVNPLVRHADSAVPAAPRRFFDAVLAALRTCLMPGTAK